MRAQSHNGLHAVIGAMGLALVVLALLYGSVLHQLSGLRALEQGQRKLISALRQQVLTCQQSGCVKQEPARPHAAQPPVSESSTIVVVKPAHSSPSKASQSHAKPRSERPKVSPSPNPSPSPCGLPLICSLTAVNLGG